MTPSPRQPSRRELIQLALAGSLGAAWPAHAQAAYPSKPITWIVPYSPGGGTDFVARAVSIEVGKRVGQSVVVDNRPGAATIVGAQLAARAPADGYTVFHADNGSLVFNPALYAKLPYKVADFAPIGLMARFPLLLVSNPTTGYATAQAVIAAAKADPQKVQFASPGAGGPHHLAMELIKSRAGFEAAHIPYKGAAPAVQDVLAGRIAVMMLDTAAALPHLKGGKLKALAVASAKRLPQFPEVPTFQELGVPGVEVYAWQGLVVPAATPEAVRQKLSSELQQAMAAPAVHKALTEFGLEPIPSDAAGMARYIESETKLWHALIRERGIKLES
ncbi:ABC transporter substrate-binding protein [Comamonas serinivorans]|uniref:ABC transporter substrate-binding protein n=1 Tax=Comamonas serinivorans TaxID=1082851 RepID=A0A1Y0EPE1_9BURK|nr:tripartite tricarboxylate transporter substrate binding protein [Comamonas serinivorans]ARU05436.1 ABC transporter substrate-binding protein [Comamonas serinivorans]